MTAGYCHIDFLSNGSAVDGPMSSRFSEEQIIAILKEQEAGMPVSELCRKHGVSDAIIYKWKAKYGGIDVSEALEARVNMVEHFAFR